MINKKLVQQIISNTQEITSLDLSDEGLFDDDLVELKTLMKKNNYIVSLNLTRNNISENGAKTLAEIHQLHSIQIGQNNLGDIGLENLLKNKNLTFMDISQNDITNKGAELLLPRIQNGMKAVISQNFKISLELANKINSTSITVEQERCFQEFDKTYFSYKN